MYNIKQEIEEIVNRETRAWDTQDVELLMTIFHPDMVWPWPADRLLPRPNRLGRRVGSLRL